MKEYKATINSIEAQRTGMRMNVFFPNLHTGKFNKPEDNAIIITLKKLGLSLENYEMIKNAYIYHDDIMYTITIVYHAINPIKWNDTDEIYYHNVFEARWGEIEDNLKEVERRKKRYKEGSDKLKQYYDDTKDFKYPNSPRVLQRDRQNFETMKASMEQPN